METVHILLGEDGLRYLLLVNMTGQGQLNNETVYGLILVEFVHHGKEFLLGDGVLECKQGALETACLASEDLIADISLATTIMAYQYGGKMRGTTTLSNNGLYFGLYLRLNLCGGCFSISYLQKTVFLTETEKLSTPSVASLLVPPVSGGQSVTTG